MVVTTHLISSILKRFQTSVKQKLSQTFLVLTWLNYQYTSSGTCVVDEPIVQW